jgi:hypothetical protein
MLPLSPLSLPSVRAESQDHPVLLFLTLESYQHELARPASPARETWVDNQGSRQIRKQPQRHFKSLGTGCYRFEPAYQVS